MDSWTMFPALLKIVIIFAFKVFGPSIFFYLVQIVVMFASANCSNNYAAINILRYDQPLPPHQQLNEFMFMQTQQTSTSTNRCVMQCLNKYKYVILET